MEEKVIYGYMEGEYLHAMEISPITQKVKNEETGEITIRVVSVTEQAAMLPPGYKPVDAIDESKQETDKEYYVIRLVPYDAGDRISYKYVEVPDLQKLKREIERLKEQLGSSDYKVIKSYEANLLGDSMPYDIKALHDERQLLRDKINELTAAEQQAQQVSPFFKAGDELESILYPDCFSLAKVRENGEFVLNGEKFDWIK